MITEEKAQAYDEVLNKLKRFMAQGVDPLITRADVQDFFPELKESEDERIRRNIIRYLKKTSPAIGENIEKMLAWLENQGEQKPIDKIEPKFRKGDWVVWKDKCYKVNYNGCGYELVDQDGLSTSLEYDTINENAHLWNIQDAKDGDVLISKYGKPFIYNGNLDSFHIGSYCGITTEGMFNVAAEKCYWTGNVNIYPSTKEQRDLLFQKMREASYEWDAEKKEVKKIEQKPTDNEMKEALRTEYEKGRADAIAEIQNHAWSEEDECYMSECIGAIATKDGWSFEEKRKTKHWLKSLKERCTWKPSDEQIKALHDLNLTGNISYAGQGQVLIELYNDLKKLAEE